jgi:hypothetical protein
MGDLVGTDRLLVALPRDGSRARVPQVRSQHGPDGGLGGCPLAPSVPDLILASITRPSFGCPWPS